MFFFKIPGLVEVTRPSKENCDCSFTREKKERKKGVCVLNEKMKIFYNVTKYQNKILYALPVVGRLVLSFSFKNITIVGMLFT